MLNNQIFVSYSRKDSEFVKRLVKALNDSGRSVWVDFEDIPFASAWWEEIKAGIDAAETGIFVLSPDSLVSEYCILELNHMLSNKKRVVPIVCRDAQIPDNANEPHKTLGSLNWIFFTDDARFDDHFATLLTTIDTDLELVRAHTSLLLKAREWERRGRNSSFLLKGDELTDFLALADRPDLSELQRDYLDASRIHYFIAQIVQRFGLGFFGGALGMAYYVFFTFRSDTMFQPISVALAVAAGEFFGLFIGLMAVMEFGLTDNIRRLIPPPLRIPARLLFVLACGTLAWVTFQWFFLQLPFALSWANFMGGVGIAAGYTVMILFKNAPVWLDTLVSAITTFLPIYFLNNLSPLGIIQNGTIIPLIYFDRPEHIWIVGVVMALLIAIGGHAPPLWQEFRRWWRHRKHKNLPSIT